MITENLTKQQRKITSHYPSSMRCWNSLQSILSFVSLMGILAIIKSRSIPMTKAKLLLLVPMELMLYRRMSFGLCNAPASFQRCMMSIFSDMTEEIMEVFMDDFSVYEKTFNDCFENLDKVLQRCEEKHLVLNWEKYHFMVREGIVLGHLVSKHGIEVD